MPARSAKQFVCVTELSINATTSTKQNIKTATIHKEAHMNLDIMQLDNLELLQYRNEVGKFGADVRKELTRREAIGFWKGGFAEVSVKQEDEVQGTVGQVRVVSR